jgi:hypothetical protein
LVPNQRSIVAERVRVSKRGPTPRHGDVAIDDDALAAVVDGEEGGDDGALAEGCALLV